MFNLRDVLTIRTDSADDACHRNLCATCVSSIIPDSAGRRGLSSARGEIVITWNLIFLGILLSMLFMSLALNVIHNMRPVIGNSEHNGDSYCTPGPLTFVWG